MILFCNYTTICPGKSDCNLIRFTILQNNVPQKRIVSMFSTITPVSSKLDRAKINRGGNSKRSKKIERIEQMFLTQFANQAFTLYKKRNESHISINSFVSNQRVFLSIDQIKSGITEKDKGTRRVSELKSLLYETKKLRLLYGNLEKRSLNKSITQAKQRLGKSHENLMTLLESRLDIVLYRAGFFPTIVSAKESIKIGHVTVNKLVITYPGYSLSSGDIVQLQSSHHSLSGLHADTNLNTVFKRKQLNDTSNALKWLEISVTNFFHSAHSFLFKDPLGAFARKFVGWDFKVSPFLIFYLQSKNFLCYLFHKKAKYVNSFLGSVKYDTLCSLFFTRRHLKSISKLSIFEHIKQSRERYLNFYSHNDLREQTIANSFEKDINTRSLKEKTSHNFLSNCLMRRKQQKIKPLHLEISYRSLSVIVLFPPQQIFADLFVDLDIITKHH